jgi:hypothetical protein
MTCIQDRLNYSELSEAGTDRMDLPQDVSLGEGDQRDGPSAPDRDLNVNPGMARRNIIITYIVDQILAIACLDSCEREGQITFVDSWLDKTHLQLAHPPRCRAYLLPRRNGQNLHDCQS